MAQFVQRLGQEDQEHDVLLEEVSRAKRGNEVNVVCQNLINRLLLLLLFNLASFEQVLLNAFTFFFEVFFKKFKRRLDIGLILVDIRRCFLASVFAIVLSGF